MICDGCIWPIGPSGDPLFAQAHSGQPDSGGGAASWPAWLIWPNWSSSASGGLFPTGLAERRRCRHKAAADLQQRSRSAGAAQHAAVGSLPPNRRGWNCWLLPVCCMPIVQHWGWQMNTNRQS